MHMDDWAHGDASRESGAEGRGHKTKEACLEPKLNIAKAKSLGNHRADVFFLFVN